MTNKKPSPTTFVFPDGEKPVISSKAFGMVYPGAREDSHGNLMVKIRAGIASLLTSSPDFVANNIHIVLSTRNTHRQREILMTEDGARAILKEIRGRAPKAMSDFVEAALDIVDERFGKAAAPAQATAPACSSLDAALARNVAVTARVAELEREVDDLREKTTQQEGWLDEAEAEKTTLRQRIAELEGTIDHIEEKAAEKAEPDKVEMIRALSAHFVVCHVPEGPAAILAASLVLDNNYGPEMIRELRPYL